MGGNTRTRKALFGFKMRPTVGACLLVLGLPAANSRRNAVAAQSPPIVHKQGSETAPSPAPKPTDCIEPRALVNEADRLQSQQKLASSQKALEKYSQARRCWQSLKLQREEAEALRSMGEIHYELGQYQQAHDCYQDALEKSKEITDLQGQAEALTALGLIHVLLDEVEKSLSYSDQALSLSHEIGNQDISARALSNMGFAHYMSGDSSKASQYLNQALVLAEKTGDRATQAQVLLYLGYVRNDAGELNEALNLYQRSLLLWQGINHPADQSRTLAAIGGIFTAIGEAQKALNYNKQALEMQQATGDRRGQAITCNNIGYTYKTLGDIDRALESYLQALACYEQLGHRSGQAQTNLFVGNMYRLLGNSQKARAHYERGKRLSAELNDKVLEALSLNNLGLLDQSGAGPRDAVSNYERALALYREVGNLRGQVVVLNNLGFALDALGEKQPALEQLLRALPIVETTQDHELEVLLRYNLARVERSLGKLDDARSHIEVGLHLIESQRIKLDRHELRTSYFASVRQLYDLDIDILMELHKQSPTAGWDAAALGVSERARARSLLELLKEAGADIQQGVDPALLTRKALLERELDTKTQERLKLGAGSQTKEAIETVDTEIRNLTREFHEVEGNIRAGSTHYNKLTQPTPLGAKEISAQLTSDTILLEYALGDARSFVWVVGTDFCTGFELPGRSKIEEAAQRLSSDIAARDLEVKGETLTQRNARIVRADADYSETAMVLSEMVIKPISPLLGNKRLAIVADGALQQISFGTLPVPKYPANGAAISGPYPPVSTPETSSHPVLLEEFEIVSLPSLSVLAMLRQEFGRRPAAPSTVAVLADPVFNHDDVSIRIAEIKRRQGSNTAASINVPSQGRSTQITATRGGVRPQEVPATDGHQESLSRALRDLNITQSTTRIRRLQFSRQEADAIYSLAPRGQAMEALDFKASRNTVMNGELSRYRIVHFATHGLVDNEHPDLSGLLLSMFDEQGKPVNGFLQLHEIYNLNLAADLVVLSACQTGVGKQIKGEGLITLTRGFMYAGAQRVVASLWKVDDAATSELMAEFYKQMFINGLKPAGALRAAQRNLSKEKRWHSPYYWAGFVLQGEWK
jgi:tetratricopeptide (TPR) repeat protein